MAGVDREIPDEHRHPKLVGIFSRSRSGKNFQGLEEARSFSETWQQKIELINIFGDREWFELEIEPDLSPSGERIWIGTAMRLGGAGAIPGKQRSERFCRSFTRLRF